MTKGEPFTMLGKRDAPPPPPVKVEGQMIMKVERSVRGLVDALFDELDAVRRGESSEARVKQVAMLSVRVTELLATEIKYRKLALEADGQEKARLSEIAGVLEGEA